MIFDFLKLITSYYKSIKILPFLDKYISWILKLSPAIISMAGLFNIWYTNFLSIFWWNWSWHLQSSMLQYIQKYIWM